MFDNRQPGLKYDALLPVEYERWLFLTKFVQLFPPEILMSFMLVIIINIS
jgi:hypothetical protein